MSNQLQITGGAKVRNLEGVLTGSTGILSSVPLGAANGVATLDSGGKVPVSQLPASVVTYLGTWNAATNTPTLTNGVGDAGDLYICNVAGTANFGAGPVTFAVGDWVLYGSGTWQKSSGQNGTVTSVAASINGNAIGLTGSPITTAGTLAFAFAGTSSQYVNGAGNLVTFPTLITSIGLSMPSAFSVSNSPLTANGTIAVTGAGSSAQYIDGTGALQTFPTIITEAQNLICDVYNQTGATLTKGTIVYINGGHGNLPSVTKSQANNETNSSQTFGIVQVDITNMNNGHVVIIGTLDNLDTSAYSDGTILYLSPTVAGAWTDVKPSAPNHMVYVGTVVRAHPTQGVVEVRIQNGYELQELHNVAITSPANGNILQYDSATFLWKNVAGTTTNIAEGTNLYYTDARARNAISLTTTGISGASTYNSTTGVLNIPQYQAALTNPVTGTGTSNYIAKFTGTSTIANSLIQDNGTNISMNSSIYSSALLTLRSIGSTNATYGIYLLNSSSVTNFYVNDAGSAYFAVGVGIATSPSSANALEVGGSGRFTSSVTASSLIKTGGTSTQFLKADGSVDSTTYQGAITLTTTGSSGAATLTSNVLNIPNYGLALSGYLPLTGGTLTGALVGTTATFNSGASSQTLTLQSASAGTQIWLSDSGTTAGYVRISSNANSLIFYANATQQLSLFSSGASAFSGSVTATSFIKTSGTSSQYLMADGSVSTLSNPVTGTGTTNYVPKFTGTGTIGNSAITDDGTTVTLVSRALSGTSATFSSTIQAGNIVNIKGIYPFVQFLNTSDARQAYIQHDLSNLVINTDVGNTIINQKLLIGTSTDSGYKLDVNGTGRFSGNLSIYTSGYPVLNLGINSSNQYSWVYDNPNENLVLQKNGSTQVTFTNTGKITASSFFDGYMSFGAAQINRSGGNVELQYSAGGGVRIFGNTAYPITFASSNGAATFSSSVTANPTTGNAFLATPQTNTNNINIRLGNATGFTYFGIDNSTGSTFGSGAYATNIYTDNATPIVLATNGTARLYVGSTGNVGIGTTSPSALLHLSGANTGYRGQLTIQSTDYAQITFYKGATTNTDLNASIFSNISTSEFVIRNNANAATIFDTNATERMRITSAGNLLIGTTTDAGTGKLQVNGAIAIGNTVTSAIAVASTNKVQISINGTTYYLLATT